MHRFNLLSRGISRTYTTNITQMNANMAVWNNLITDMIAAGGGIIRVPPGDYCMRGIPVSALTGALDTQYPSSVYIEGSGAGASRFFINPNADMDNEAGWFWFGRYSIGQYPGQVNQCGIEGLSIISLESAYRKTAIKFEAASHGCFIRDIYVVSGDGSGIEQWRGKNSRAIHFRGHEQMNVEEVTLYASVPVKFDANPINYPGTVQGYGSCDHFNFHNYAFLPGPATAAPTANSGTEEHAAILFGDSTDITELSFTGRGAVVGGKFGIRADWTTTMTAFSSLLMIKGWRTEGLTSGGDSFSVYINNATAQPLRKLILERCEFDNAAKSGDGMPSQAVYCKGVNDVLLDACHVPHMAGRILKIDPTGDDGTECLQAEVRNLYVSYVMSNTAFSLPANMRRVFVSSHAGFGTHRLGPFSAIWRREQASDWQQYPQIGIGDINIGTQQFVLADGATRGLGLDSERLRTRLGLVTIMVAGTTLASTLHGKAEYLIAPTAMSGSTNGIRLLSTVGVPAEALAFGATPTSGAFALTARQQLSSEVQLVSNLNEPALFIVKYEVLQQKQLIERGITLNGSSQAIESNGGATIQHNGAALPDGGNFTFFASIYLDNLAATRRIFTGDVAGTRDGLDVNVTIGTGNLGVTMYQVGGATTAKSCGAVAAGQWLRILISCCRTLNRFQCYVNDSQLLNTTADLAADIRWSNPTRWAIGKTGGGVVYLPGRLSAIMFSHEIGYDLTDVLNRRIFHGAAADGCPLADYGVAGTSAFPNGPFVFFGGQQSVDIPINQGWSRDIGGGVYRAFNRGNGTDWAVSGGPLVDVVVP